ncbi:MAG: PTS sugar transporter subunit IIB [Anaerostipes sp.]|jgi:D-glucosaminate-specific PTS system IIB component|nr:PTS sugar transporter subunit IIB [Anaerostipes sp.]MDD3746658.1 PTS sugar transporter subunit IIB [Anaerostipes sp.]MDD4371591.1 PTS sugar transporter subunit IIB [Anaerostipes sp.]
MAKKIAVRVDDRLIHGQVMTQWVKVCKSQKIVVIDDVVAKDKMQKNILKFATPPDMKSSILSVDKAIEIWNKNQFGDKNVFVLFRDVTQIAKLKEKGLSFDEITIGNMSIKDGRKQLYKSTGFTQEEAQVLLDLEKSGIKLYFQTQPTDKKESMEILKKAFPNLS